MQVESLDGTSIGFRRGGHGPAVVLVHGGMQASQNLRRLAAELSDAFEVIVPDRRGRGMSGPHGDRYGMAREVEDLQAVVAATGATRVFGLSAGALVALRTALETPALQKVALYEPPVSVAGSVPLGWVERYDREIAAGKVSAALITALKGMRTEPVMARIPRFVLASLFAIAPGPGPAEPGDVPIRDLVPAQHFDIQLVTEMADGAADYASLEAEVLLMGGGKSPAYLGLALDALERVLPRSRRIVFDTLGHSGPDDDGDPARVGAELRAFFA